MSSVKAPGSEKWSAPSSRIKAPTILNIRNKNRTAQKAPGSINWKTPVPLKHAPAQNSATTNTQTFQTHHAVISIFAGLALVGALSYSYLASSFSNELKGYYWEHYYGNYITLSADFTDTEIILDANAPLLTYRYDSEIGRLNYFIIAPGLIYVFADGITGQICSVSIDGDVLTFSPGIITDESTEIWIR